MMQQRIQRHAAETTGSDGRPRRPTSGRIRRSSSDQSRDQAYGPRIPAIRPGQPSSVYDWAPASASQIEHGNRSLPPLLDHELLHEEDMGQLRFSLQAHSSRESSSIPRYGSSQYHPPDNPTFRMAVMQSLRNNTRRNQRPRPHGQDWSSDREPTRGGRDGLRVPLESMISRSRALRMRHDPDRGIRLPAASLEIEKTMEYLSKVRMCQTPEESLKLAARSGFNSPEDWLNMLDENPTCDDFLLDTMFLDTAETSWLKAGGVFWGSQTTPASSSSASAYHGISHRPVHSSSSSQFSMPSVPSNAAQAPSSEGSAQSRDSRRHSLENSFSTSTKWQVRVNISSVNYSQMRLSTSCILP